nr:MAG TPA: hypothetical protein [Caudoviricetes sp.]
MRNLRLSQITGSENKRSVFCEFSMIIGIHTDIYFVWVK